MKSAREPKEYNRIFRKKLFQVLIDPTRGKLFKDICEDRGEKASAVLRSLAYEYAQNNCDIDIYKKAELEDKRLFDEAQQSRIDNGFNWTKE
tara:strand:+ start:569 stop:844 length:276 start_codon:yes stop_codon:yes gene_type:complete